MTKLISWEEWCLGRRVSVQPGSYVQPPDDPIDESGVALPMDEEVEPAIQIVNEAHADTLSEIKGVGPKTIERLLENRPFSDFEDMKSRGKIPVRAHSSLQTWAESKNCALQQEKDQ